MKLIISFILIAGSFFASLFPGDCITYTDDTGRLMRACANHAAPACSVSFYAGPERVYDGAAYLQQGASLDEEWDIPAMHCGWYAGRPMLEMWSGTKQVVRGWVFLPVVK